MSNAENITTIALSRQTHKRVKLMESGGESFDDLVTRMAAQYDPSEGLEGADS